MIDFHFCFSKLYSISQSTYRTKLQNIILITLLLRQNEELVLCLIIDEGEWEGACWPCTTNWLPCFHDLMQGNEVWTVCFWYVRCRLGNDGEISWAGWYDAEMHKTIKESSINTTNDALQCIFAMYIDKSRPAATKNPIFCSGLES